MMNLLRNLSKRNRIVPVQISKKSPKKSPRNTPNSIRNSPNSIRNSPNSIRKSPRNTPKKSPRKSLRNTPKSPRNSPRKSPRNSPRNSLRKSPRNSLRNTPNTPNSIRKSPRNTPNTPNTPKKSPVKSPKQIKRRARQCTYCGNNLLSPLLEANGGDCILGTNYQCLKKGIGYGIYSPIDLDFINYEPIDPPENIYCGDKRPLPDEYERFGRRSSCLRKGVGIGKKIKIQREGLNG